MKILALDTATENCSAALLIDGNLRSREIETARGHADRILPMIDELLSEAGVSLPDLAAIAFGRGPGSFTGVRLAGTVTQGLAFGAGLGEVPVSDLQAVAQRALGTDPALDRLLVCNDARMSEVYWACFERDARGLARLEGEEHVSKPSEVTLPSTWSTATAVGRGFTAYADALRTALPTVVVPALIATTAPTPALPRPQAPAYGHAPTHASAPPQSATANLTHLLPRAQEIALLALPTVTAGQLLPPESATPIYLRDNVAHVAHAPKGPT